MTNQQVFYVHFFLSFSVVCLLVWLWGFNPVVLSGPQGRSTDDANFTFLSHNCTSMSQFLHFSSCNWRCVFFYSFSIFRLLDELSICRPIGPRDRPLSNCRTIFGVHKPYLEVSQAAVTFQIFWSHLLFGDDLMTRLIASQRQCYMPCFMAVTPWHCVASSDAKCEAFVREHYRYSDRFSLQGFTSRIFCSWSIMILPFCSKVCSVHWLSSDAGVLFGAAQLKQLKYHLVGYEVRSHEFEQGQYLHLGACVAGLGEFRSMMIWWRGWQPVKVCALHVLWRYTLGIAWQTLMQSARHLSENDNWGYPRCVQLCLANPTLLAWFSYIRILPYPQDAQLMSLNITSRKC